MILMSDWREEFDCPRCKEWQGRPPISIKEGREFIEQTLQEAGIDTDGMTLEHVCAIGRDSFGEPYHIPGTAMQLPDGKYVQWLPEQPT
jgi:hypothetical protein